jgi:excisionase family DNA binding protein
MLVSAEARFLASEGVIYPLAWMRVSMKDFTPISTGHLVANCHGQLFLKADPTMGAAAIDVSKFIEQLALKVAKEIELQPADAMITAEQAAELLNCSPATIHRLTKDGSIPSTKFGSLRRYRKSTLLNLPPRAESNIPMNPL